MPKPLYDKKELKKVYLDVVKKFPDIKPKELKLECYPLDSTAGLLMFNFLFKYEPTLIVGRFFFSLSPLEKEATIAHELGHYHRLRKYGRKKLLNTLTLNFIACNYQENSEADERKKRFYNRVEKWYALFESYADNKAAEAGYAAGLISVLKKICQREGDGLQPMVKKGNLLRIGKLEEKLKLKG